MTDKNGSRLSTLTGPPIFPIPDGIFTTGEDQSRVAKAYIAQLDQANVFPRRIVTQVLPLPAFYPAEGKYQNYAALNRTQPYVAPYAQPAKGRIAGALHGQLGVDDFGFPIHTSNGVVYAFCRHTGLM